MTARRTPRLAKNAASPATCSSPAAAWWAARSRSRLPRGDISVARIVGEVRGADRPIALSHGSRLILDRLGAWSSIPSTPIKSVHVSQRGHFGRALLRCEEHGLPALGYVSAYTEVQHALAVMTPAVAGNAEGLEGGRRGRRCPRDRRREGTATADATAGACRRRREPCEKTRGRKDFRLRSTCDYRGSPRRTFARRHRVGTMSPAEGPLALLPFRNHHALVWGMRPASAKNLNGFARCGISRPTAPDVRRTAG